MKINISEPKNIFRISSIVHDEWFNKNDISYFPERAVLELKFKRKKTEEKKIIKKFLFFKKISYLVVESFIIINYVKSYKVEDMANIMIYDFNEIEYDEKQNKIVITSGFPFKIEIEVDKFQISLEDTDKIVNENTFWSFAGVTTTGGM